MQLVTVHKDQLTGTVFDGAVLLQMCNRHLYHELEADYLLLPQYVIVYLPNSEAALSLAPA